MTCAPLSMLPGIGSLTPWGSTVTASHSLCCCHRWAATLFLIILYVNCYCGIVTGWTAAMASARRCAGLTDGRERVMLCIGADGLLKSGTVHGETRVVKARTKPKASEKPAAPRKSAVARLVQSNEPTIDDEAEDRARGGVQSLGRAFAILEEIARHREGIGLADLSKRVGLHNSTTFHLAKTMVSLGYIRQERDTKRYRVGRPLFALAASALDEIEMVNLATPVLEDLSRESGESGHFAVRMGDAVIVIARTSGAGAFQLTDRVGVVRPAHCTALGKIILASLRPDQLKRFLERVELKPSTRKSITDPAVLLREIAEVRRSALAIDDGEFNSEVRCVAVPVYNFTGDVIGALGISGPIWRMTDQVLQSRAKTVQVAANRLSAEFGAKGAAKGAAKVS